VNRGPRTALYTLPADLLFDSGESVLRPSSLVVVEEVAREIVDRFPGKPIIVRGHTDSVGGSPANRELSMRRAEAVAAILVDWSGIGPIEVEAFGEFDPRASNETAAGRAQNRRVEILVRTRR
jgi:outer membrane protein OmpA-like peptidoglycan-associated protein